jgi:hypothetical protein
LKNNVSEILALVSIGISLAGTLFAAGMILGKRSHQIENHDSVEIKLLKAVEEVQIGLARIDERLRALERKSFGVSKS